MNTDHPASSSADATLRLAGFVPLGDLPSNPRNASENHLDSKVSWTFEVAYAKALGGERFAVLSVGEFFDETPDEGKARKRQAGNVFLVADGQVITRPEVDVLADSREDWVTRAGAALSTLGLEAGWGPIGAELAGSSELSAPYQFETEAGEVVDASSKEFRRQLAVVHAAGILLEASQERQVPLERLPAPWFEFYDHGKSIGTFDMGRYPEVLEFAQRQLAHSGQAAIDYARNVLQGPFHAAEAYLAQRPSLAMDYVAALPGARLHVLGATDARVPQVQFTAPGAGSQVLATANKWAQELVETRGWGNSATAASLARGGPQASVQAKVLERLELPGFPVSWSEFRLTPSQEQARQASRSQSKERAASL